MEGGSMRRLVFIVFLLVVPRAAHAQSETYGILFDQGNVTSVATAHSYIYRFYIDGNTTGLITPVTCTMATQGTFAVCQTGPLPAGLPAGTHTLTMTAANGTAESAKSTVFSFTVEGPIQNAPAVPVNFRLVRLP
jgi:hypothetical protein